MGEVAHCFRVWLTLSCGSRASNLKSKVFLLLLESVKREEDNTGVREVPVVFHAVQAAN